MADQKADAKAAAQVEYPVLVDVFVKSFLNTEKETIRYAEIWLSDRIRQMVYKMKPYNTANFIDELFPKIERELIGKRVALITESKYVKDHMETFVVDILPVDPVKTK